MTSGSQDDRSIQLDSIRFDSIDPRQIEHIPTIRAYRYIICSLITIFQTHQHTPTPTLFSIKKDNGHYQKCNDKQKFLSIFEKTVFSQFLFRPLYITISQKSTFDAIILIFSFWYTTKNFNTKHSKRI